MPAVRRAAALLALTAVSAGLVAAPSLAAPAAAKHDGASAKVSHIVKGGALAARGRKAG